MLVHRYHLALHDMPRRYYVHDGRF